MKMSWWGASCQCQECNSDTILQMVMFASDGQFRFIYWCQRCKDTRMWDVYASQIAHQALLNDLEKARKASPTVKPLKPPLQIKPPLMTDKDKKDAHDMGINLENGDE